MAPKKQPKKAPQSSPKKSNNDSQNSDPDEKKPATPTSASGSKLPTTPEPKPSQQQSSRPETPPTAIRAAPPSTGSTPKTPGFMRATAASSNRRDGKEKGKSRIQTGSGSPMAPSPTTGTPTSAEGRESSLSKLASDVGISAKNKEEEENEKEIKVAAADESSEKETGAESVGLGITLGGTQGSNTTEKDTPSPAPPIDSSISSPLVAALKTLAQPRPDPQPDPEHIHRSSISLPQQPPSSPLAQPTAQTPPPKTIQPSSSTTNSPPADDRSASGPGPDIKIEPTTPDPAENTKKEEKEEKWPWQSKNPDLGKLSPVGDEEPAYPFKKYDIKSLKLATKKGEREGSEVGDEKVSPIDDEPSGGEGTGGDDSVVSPIESSAKKGVGAPNSSPGKEGSPPEGTSIESGTANPISSTKIDDSTALERALASSRENTEEFKPLPWGQQPPLNVFTSQGGRSGVRGQTFGYQSISPHSDPPDEEGNGNGDDDRMQDVNLDAGAELQRSSQTPIDHVMRDIRVTVPTPGEVPRPTSPWDNPLERQDAGPLSWNISPPRRQGNVQFFEPATAIPLPLHSFAPVMNLRGANTDSEAEPAPKREQLREWADAEDRENAEHRRIALGGSANLQEWPLVQPPPPNTRAKVKFEPAYTPKIDYPPGDGQLAPRMDLGNVTSLLAQFEAEQKRQAEAVRRMKEEEQRDPSSPLSHRGDLLPDNSDDSDDSDDPHDGPEGGGVGRGEASRRSSSSDVSFSSDFKKPTGDPPRRSVIEPPSNTTIDYPGNRPLAAVVGDAEAANFQLRQQWLGIWPGQDESTRDPVESEEKENPGDNPNIAPEDHNVPAPTTQAASPRLIPPPIQRQYKPRAGAIPLEPPKMLPQAFRDFEQLVNQNLDEPWANLADQALSSARALFSNHQFEAITHRLASAEAAQLVNQFDEMNTELTRDMERQRAELNKLSQRLQEADEAYRDGERRNGMANQKIRDLWAQVEGLEAQLAAATAMNIGSEDQTQVNRQLTDLQATHEAERANLQSQISASRQATRDARKQIKKLTRQLQEGRSSTDDARDNYIDQLKNDTTKTCEAKLEELHEILITATTDAAIDKATLEANIEELKKHAQEGMITEDECDKRNKEAAKKIAELERQLKAAESDLLQTRDELDQARNQEDQDTTTTSPVPPAESQFDQTHSKLVEQLRQIMNRSSIMVVGQHDELYRNSFHPIVKGVEQLGTNHQQLATQVTTLTTQVAKLTQERDSLQANNSPARNHELTKRVAELEGQLKNCQKQQIHNRGIIAERDERIQRLAENREADKKTMRDDDQTMRKLQQTLTESVDTVESLTHALEGCRSEHDNMDRERGKLRKDIERLENQNRQLQDVVNRGSGPDSAPRPGQGREQQTTEDERPRTPGVPSVNGFEFAMARARHALAIMRRERASNDAHPPDDIEMGIRAVEESVRIAEELPEESSMPLQARARLEAGIVHYYANGIGEAGTHFLNAEYLANHLSEDDKALLSQWIEWIADGNTVEIRREGYMSEEQREYEQRRRRFQSSDKTTDKWQKQRHESKETPTGSKNPRSKDGPSKNKRPRTKHSRDSPTNSRYKKRSKGKDRRGQKHATDLEPQPESETESQSVPQPNQEPEPEPEPQPDPEDSNAEGQ